jgi:heme oxygenase (biliverdin-IX-beta and delta-forming)
MRSLTVDLPAPSTPDVPGAVDRSLLAALRAATRSAHERLEAALPLTDPGLTLEAYRSIVEALYGYYAPLEARLARVAEGSAGGLPIHGREKLGRLRGDLKALGATDASVDALPLCGAVPEVSTPGAAFGCLYVVEGATLGGRVIVRRLRDRLGLGPTTGAAFFDGYGVETGAMWASFCEQLVASPWERAETLAAAVATFVELEGWLRKRGTLR